MAVAQIHTRTRLWICLNQDQAGDGTDELAANKAVYAENRALLLSELPKAGLERIVPALSHEDGRKSCASC